MPHSLSSLNYIGPGIQAGLAVNTIVAANAASGYIAKYDGTGTCVTGTFDINFEYKITV